MTAVEQHRILRQELIEELTETIEAHRGVVHQVTLMHPDYYDKLVRERPVYPPWGTSRHNAEYNGYNFGGDSWIARPRRKHKVKSKIFAPSTTDKVEWAEDLRRTTDPRMTAASLYFASGSLPELMEIG